MSFPLHCGAKAPAPAIPLLCLLLLLWLIRVISAPPDNTACLESYALYLTSDPPLRWISSFKLIETEKKRARANTFFYQAHIYERLISWNGKDYVAGTILHTSTKIVQ